VVPDARAAGNVDAPAVSRVRRLRLELESRPDGVSGVVHDERGSSVTFWGWLELIALVAPAGTDDPPFDGSAPTGPPTIRPDGNGEQT
jgi:hypothetical protein